MSSLDLLAKVPSFGRLPSDALRDLEHSLDVRDYPAGHTFLREGERGNRIYFILDGRVSVTRELYVEHELNQLGPTDLFGLLALIDDEPRSASCQAVTPCTVGEWTRTAVTMLFHRHGAVAHAFQLALARQLARDFRQLDQRVRSRLESSWAVK